MEHRKYKALFEWNEDVGGYTVTVPTLPGCISEGDSFEEALENVKEAIAGYIEAIKNGGLACLPE